MSMLFIYGSLALLTTVGFLYMHYKYYGINAVDTTCYIVATLTGSFWFFGIPIIIWRYHKEMLSILQGRDWVADNVPDKKEAELFREQYDDLHRQVVLETTRTKKAIENLRENAGR